MNINQKVRMKINEHRYFVESNFVGGNTFFVLVYENEDANAKRFKTRRYYLLKGNIDNYNVIINGKKFFRPSN